MQAARPPGATVGGKRHDRRHYCRGGRQFTLRGLTDGNYTVEVRYTGHVSREVAAIVPGPH